MKRFRLTKAAKILIMIIILLAVFGGAFAAIKTGIVKPNKENSNVINENATESNKNEETSNTNENKEDNNVDVSDATINLSLDEWIG